MPGDTIGQLFRVTNWGESHGKAIGVVVEGCPPKVKIDVGSIQKSLDRRAPGQSEVTTSRAEKDRVEVLSGIFDGLTTGAPISMIIYNKDVRTKDYSNLKDTFRPGHADFAYLQKYGIRDYRGGGRSSARLTACSVAAGEIAKKVLDIEILAYVKQVKNISAEIDPLTVKLQDIESNVIRCPDKKSAMKMIAAIKEAKDNGDSVGGIIECIIKNPPPGLGEPVYDKLDCDLAKAILSINATIGFEIGSGFNGASSYGSENNDEIVAGGKTSTNNSGGIIGGISNGMPIIFRVAFKPTSTIQKRQQTIDTKGKKVIIEAKGRHDPCVLPRAVPIVEAMAAIILCDHYLRQKAISWKK